MKDQNLALILFAIHELQVNIQYAPDQILNALKDYYGVAIASPQDLFDALNDLAINLNCGDENV